ncbi:MAG: MarR family transcriptional regulator [Desulfobulbaceae bacterium]|nr:MarR family transcriptional regulator [Desulfobulbaceae bacterium]
MQKKVILMNELAEQFVKYLFEVTGQRATCRWRSSAMLPQFLVQQYDLYDITIDKRNFLGILLAHGEGFRPAVFEKHLRQILTVAPDAEGYCLIAEELQAYVRQRLVERKVPFVVPGLQLNWPELGLAVQARKKKKSPVAVDTVSPATQAVLINALTGGMQGPATQKKLATRLGYTTMSMSRALDEIEANGLGRVQRKGRERLLDFPEGMKALWKAALPFFRNPVRKTVRIMDRQLPQDSRIEAGETALARMSMLMPPKEPIYAVGRQVWKKIAGQVEMIPIEEKGTCLVQVWYYDPSHFARHGRVDCFSLYLSLREEVDERVEGALEEMMENVAWL